MALRQSVQIVQKLPSISADGYASIVIVGDFTTVAGVVATDIIEMGVLPAGYVPVDVALAVEDMDSNATPTITLDVGLVSGVAGAADNARTSSNEAIAASTIGQTGGLARMAKQDFAFLAPSTADRGVGVKVVGAIATLVVGAKLRLTIIARPALNGA